MKILLFGISCVGKTTVGKLLAKKLEYNFIDLDNVIINKYNTMDKFNDLYPWDYSRYKIKGEFLEKLIEQNNVVIAVSIINYSRFFNKLLKDKNVVAFELRDSVENIFKRLQFYDEVDKLCEDSAEYKEKHKEHYIEEIKEDIKYYKNVFKKVENKIDINGQNAEFVADEIYKKIKEN